LKTKVYYEDTDAGGVVYHTNYLKYCERARSELFFSRGLMPFDGENSGFLVKSVNAKFLSSAKLGDTLEIKTEIINIKRVSVELNQSIYRDNIKIFDSEIVLAFVKRGKLSKIPEKFVNIFKICN
jgi:acyl-CoA thioester hydrolase